MVQDYGILLSIFDTQWIENHLLYFSLLGGVVIVAMLFLIIRKISKDIKEMDKKSRKSSVDYIRKTSKHNKDNERKRLKFE